MNKEKKANIKLLTDMANDLRGDFIEAKNLRDAKVFSNDDKQYFMTRCKQAEGVISATKNSLENIKYLEKYEK
jgi:hypothetical protein